MIPWVRESIFSMIVRISYGYWSFTEPSEWISQGIGRLDCILFTLNQGMEVTELHGLGVELGCLKGQVRSGQGWVRRVMISMN